MAGLNGPVLENYRRYISPSLGEFDINMMMEKATVFNVIELEEKKVRMGGNDSCVVNMPTNDGIKMFRQRAQVDTGGK